MLPKICRRSVLLFVAAALVLGGWAGAARAGETTWRLSTVSDPRHPNNIAIEGMIKRIKERTGGKLNIVVFPSNTLGNPNDVTEQGRLGVVDLVLLSPSHLDKYDPAFATLMVPFQFDGFEHAWRAEDGAGFTWYKERAQKAGFELLANFAFGFRNITNNVRPIQAPDDLKGLKMRVPPELQVKAAMEALGAVTMTVPLPEVYMALANRVVDGQCNPVALIHSLKYYEVQKYLSIVNYAYTNAILTMGARKWNSVPEEWRKILVEEATAAGKEARKILLENEAKYIADMEKAGMKVNRVDPAPFRAKMEPAYAALQKWIGQDNWNTWKKIVDESRGK